ncbi:unnamed protein product, partial [Brenthis ino]
MRLALALAGLLFVVALAAAADIQCYVCDDCESDFKNNAKTCEASSGNAQEGNAPGGNAQEGNAPGGNAQEGNAPGGNAQEGNAPGGNAQEGNAPGGNAQKGNAPGGNAQEGNAPGGNAQEGNAPGGNAQEGNAPGGNAQEGNAPGGNSKGGNAEGGNAKKGYAEGGNAGGGETGSNAGGSETEKGNAGGGNTGGSGGESGQSYSADTSPSKGALNETPRAVHIDKRSIQMYENSATATRAPLLRFVRQAGARASEVRCVTASFEENGKTKVKRGCSLSGANDAERCKALIGSTSQVKDCKVCEGNLCNAAPKLAVAMVPIIISLFINF